MADNLIYDYNFLSDTFKILDKYSWWVQNAYQPFSNVKTILSNLDNISSFLENNSDNKEIIAEKIKRIYNTEINWKDKKLKDLEDKEREHERQLWAFFIELMASKELNEKKFKEIKFLRENKKSKTPDFFAQKDNSNHYFEIKHIQVPRKEDEELKSKGVYCDTANTEFRGPLSKKIGDFICDAKQKFVSVNDSLKKEQKTLIIDFDIGIDAGLISEKGFKSNLDDIYSKEFFDNLEQIHDINIWRRRYLNN